MQQFSGEEILESLSALEQENRKIRSLLDKDKLSPENMLELKLCFERRGKAVDVLKEIENNGKKSQFFENSEKMQEKLKFLLKEDDTFVEELKERVGELGSKLRSLNINRKSVLKYKNEARQ